MKGPLSFAVFALAAAVQSAAVSLDSRHAVYCQASGISAERAQQVKSAFRSSKLITDTVPDINPQTEVSVAFNGKAENLGNTFAVTETLKEPTISFKPVAGQDPAATKYTYIMVDPDAPGPELPLLRHFLHHIIYDMQPDCIPDQTPKTQASYMLLTPLSVSQHRYVSLVYRQPPNYTPHPLDPVLAIARAPFNLQEYVDNNHLELVGGNFMKEGLANVLPAP